MQSSQERKKCSAHKVAPDPESSHPQACHQLCSKSITPTTTSPSPHSLQPPEPPACLHRAALVPSARPAVLAASATWPPPVPPALAPAQPPLRPPGSSAVSLLPVLLVPLTQWPASDRPSTTTAVPRSLTGSRALPSRLSSTDPASPSRKRRRMTRQVSTLLKSVLVLDNQDADRACRLLCSTRDATVD